MRATKRLVMSVFSGLGREDNDCTCFLIPSLWRGAVLMVNRYADAAQAKADRCVPDELRPTGESRRSVPKLEIEGDHTGAGIWRRVTVAIEQLADTTGPLH